jgi:hypothetical protein
VDDTEIKWLIALLLAAAAAAAAWFFWDRSEPPPIAPAAVEQQAPVAEPAEPLHPVEPLSISPGEGELVALPPLEESDSYFALALIDIFGPELETLLAEEALIDKTVATVDNLTRGRIAEKIRPVGRLSGNFIVSAASDNGPFYLSPENYDRYRPLVTMVTGADHDELIATYRRFFIDHLLATPEPEEPIRLVQPHVLYKFADPELEALSSGQKLLIRMGPDHAARIRDFLTELRTHIAQPPR